MSRHRDVGTMGEKELEKWCSSRGIVATRPDKDEHGWDHILEFPDNREDGIINLPLSTAGTRMPIKCVVQVKSTDGRDGRESVPLKNWERLAVHWPIPAFFLVLEYDNKDSIENAYLVHIGEELISKILERRRRIQADPAPVAREPSMDVSYNERHRLKPPDGAGLERAIANHVGAPEEYFKWKVDYIQSVGYEDGKWRFSIKPPPGVTTQLDYLDYVVNLTLGLESPLQISELEFFDRRFDIPIKDAPFLGEGELEILPNPSGKARIQFKKGLQRMTLEADTFLPVGLDLSENPELIKARLARPFLNMIVTPFRAKGTKMNISWPDSRETVPLKDLKILGDFFLLMKPPVAPIIMKLEIDLYKPPESGDSKLELPECTLDSVTIDEGVFQVAECINNATVIATAFNVFEAANVSLSQLMHVEERLRIMSFLINPGGRRMRVTTSLKEPNDAFLGRIVCTPVVFGVRIGEYKLLAGFSAWGEARDSGETDYRGEMIYEIISDRIELSRKLFFQGDESIDVTAADVIRDIVKEVESRDSSVECLILDWYDQEPKGQLPESDGPDREED